MSQAVITKAFAEWKAQQAVDNQPVTLDEFIFAYIPGLDTETPIDNTETVPPADKIVHRQAVSKTGVVNENAVVYSVTLGADRGDFDFNWIGLVNKASGTLAMIIHAPTQRKIKNEDGKQGNVLVRSMLMEYSGAKTATEITTPAETWQIDFTARLAAMDERQRLENIDLYGAAAFFDSGYLVAKSGARFYVTKGVGYVAGLRSELTENQDITVSAKPVRVWLDVSWTGTLTSEWAVQSKITLADNLADYVSNGVQHYVFAIASIDADGNITDLRPKGTLNEQQASDELRRHEQSRNHPDATTSERGFTQLSSATDSNSEELAATPKAVKIAMDNANARLAKDRNGADIPNKPLFIQNVGLQETVDQADGAVQRSGDEMTGPLKIRATDALRIYNDAFGLIMRRSEDFLHFIPTEENQGQSGGLGPLRPFSINLRSGKISANHGFNIVGGLGLGVDNTLGGNSIALGDNDTGFKQNGDGVLDVIANNVQVMRIISNAAQVNNWSGSWISMRDQICYTGQNMVSNDSASAIVRQEHQDRHFYVGGLGNYQFGFYMTNKSRSENGTDGQAYMDNEGNWLCGKNIQAGDAIKTGGGASTIGANGDIWGAAWGNEWLSTRINAMATSEWVRQWFVQDVSRGAGGTLNTASSQQTWVPAGCVMIGVSLDAWGSRGTHVTQIHYCPLQIWRGNGWATISG